jgi:hypothetical protein
MPVNCSLKFLFLYFKTVSQYFTNKKLKFNVLKVK